MEQKGGKSKKPPTSVMVSVDISVMFSVTISVLIFACNDLRGYHYG